MPATRMRTFTIAICYWPLLWVSGNQRRTARAAYEDDCLVVEGLLDLHYLTIGKTSNGQLAGYVGTKFPPLIEREGIRTHAG